MKQLMFPEIGKSVSLVEPQFITLVLEHPSSMRAYCEELFSGFGEKSNQYRLVEDGKQLYLDEHAFFLPSPFALELNSKRNVNALLKILKKSYFDQLSESVKDIQKRIEEAVDSIRLDFDVEISSDFCLKTDDIFKIANIKFEETFETPLEKLSKFLSVENELHRTTILFALHLRSYFSDEEIRALQSELAYRGWTIVDLESHDQFASLEEEHRFIVDRDLCVI